MALKEQTKAAEKNIFNQTFKSNQTNQKGEIMRQLTQRVRAFSTLGRHRQWQAGTRAGRVRGNTGKNERQAGRRRNKHGGRLRGVARMYTDRGVWQECTQVEGCGKNVHKQRDVASM